MNPVWSVLVMLLALVAMAMVKTRRTGGRQLSWKLLGMAVAFLFVGGLTGYLLTVS